MLPCQNPRGQHEERQQEDRLRPQKLIRSPPQLPFQIIPLANLRLTYGYAIFKWPTQNAQVIKQKIRKNDIFWVSNSCFHRDVFILFQIFCNSREKCLRTTDCLLRGILSFQCALVMNNFVNKRTCDIFRNNIAKTLFHKTKAFIVINVRFENWQISVETYPRIFSIFYNLFIILLLLVLFDLLMRFDQSCARKNIWWFITVGILRQLR